MSADTLTVGCPAALQSSLGPHAATATRRDGGWSVKCTLCGYQARQTTAEAAELDKLAGAKP